MRKPGRGPERVLTDRHRYKITMDVILEFLHQLPDDEFNNPEKPNYSTKDFTLAHLWAYMQRRIDIMNMKNKEAKLIEK